MHTKDLWRQNGNPTWRGYDFHVMMGQCCACSVRISYFSADSAVVLCSTICVAWHVSGELVVAGIQFRPPFVSSLFLYLALDQREVLPTLANSLWSGQGGFPVSS
jgi:hypothetical protein